MKILAVTGKLAEETVKKSVLGRADVLTLDIDIAAFVTPSLLRRNLGQHLKGYDLILIPGLATADFSGLEKEIGIPIRLGPKHACDLGFILPFADVIEFSNDKPACEILMSKKREDALKEVKDLESEAKASFLLGDLKIGGDSRMKVMAEIVDAHRMREEELESKIEEFITNRADIIDLGMGLDASPGSVRRTVDIATSLSNTPLSIDTLDPKLILAALGSVDMVLSLNEGNIAKIGKRIAGEDVAAVIVPDDDDLDRCAESTSERPEGTRPKRDVFRNINAARKAGIEKIIADPTLTPIGHGAIRSLVDYHGFRLRDESTPLFFGIGNITETIDADSVGANAVLAGLAMELNASILFTPEYSDKAKGSIGELKKASQMMMLARRRKSPPKDLGIDLLVLKEKRRRNIPFPYEKRKGKLDLVAVQKRKWKRDPLGSFTIHTSDGKIYANHADLTIIGESAKDVFDTIVELGLISTIDHAGYLGRELIKAELSLRFGRSYAQDDVF
jgi:dihydropteroate synthase-like protein